MKTDIQKPFQVTHKMVLALALPMTLAYLTTPLLGLVDTAVVGRLGDAALIGGLAVGAIIIDMLFTTFNFLRSGTTGLTAQAFGKEDEKEKQAVLFRAAIIAVLSGFVMIMLSPLIISLGLYFMAPSERVATATSDYFTIRIFAAPLSLINFVILGWLIGLGRSGLGLILQIVLNGTNIIFSMLLGLHFGFGLEGVAWATVLGEAVAAILGLFLCWQLLDHSIRPSKQRVLDRVALKRFANLNMDIMIRSFALLFAFAFFTSKGAKFGDVTLAANAVLLNFFMIAGFFLDGLATAAEQIVGRAIGANHKPAFWRGLKLTGFWNAMMALILTLIFVIFGTQLIALITTLPAVQLEAQTYLLLAALSPLTGVLAYQLDGVFIGATWSREMSKMMVLSLAIYLIAWWALQPMENLGLWLALHIFLIARGLSLSAVLPSKVRDSF